MNEKIKDLLIKSGAAEVGPGQWDERFHKTWGDIEIGGIGIVREDFLEKFAQLIVQECADIVHDRILEIDIEFPGKGVSNHLKEQFGIEE